VLVEGEPALTEMAATAFCELLAYAELLKKNRGVSLSSLPGDRVESFKQLLKKSWNFYSAREKSEILTTPGLWITFRTLLRFGSTAQKEQIRLQLLKLAPEISSGSASGDSSKPRSMVEHTVLMNIQQQTFNHYMWSRGFKSTMLGY
jgi:hypothetical protein